MCTTSHHTAAHSINAHPIPALRIGAHRYPAAFVLCVLLGLTAGAASAQPVAINLRLPSEAAGGGNLAVRLSIPPASVGARYPDEAPIIVFAAGGHGAGALAAGAEYAMQGFVVVSFLFPGGTSAPFHSDGSFDYRGQNCINALRDVIRYAGGLLPDDLGRTIQAVLPFPALMGMVGLTGSSNGGPISMAVLGQYGDQLPFLATYVGWENPTNGQTVAVEAGGKSYDCDPGNDGDGNGIPDDDGKNPYILGYGESITPMDFERLAYDPSFVRVYTDPAGIHAPIQRAGVLFLDGNHNGVMDVVPGGSECADVNGNGRLDSGEDYLLRPIAGYETGSFLLHFSLPTIQEAYARGVFERTWPADIAGPVTGGAYWSLRDATGFYGAIGQKRPDLHAMLVFAASDHVQAADEHIHIQQAYDGLRGQGIWCRLNPDRSYFLAVNASPPGDPVDTDANTAVAWPAMALYDEPYPVSSTQGATAGIMEMADRAYFGSWAPNLDGILNGSSANVSSAVSSRPVLRVLPQPAGARSVLLLEGPWNGPVFVRLIRVDGRVVRERTLQCYPAEGVSLAQLTDGLPLARGVYRVEARTARGVAVAALVVAGW
jgi:hypothetical protein